MLDTYMPYIEDINQQAIYRYITMLGICIYNRIIAIITTVSSSNRKGAACVKDCHRLFKIRIYSLHR